MAKQLIPCPFCGSALTHVERVIAGKGTTHYHAYRVICYGTHDKWAVGCGASTADYRSEKDATKAWNRRDKGNNENKGNKE